MRSRHEVLLAESLERESPDATDALLEAMLIEDALAELSLEHRAVTVRADNGGRSVAAIAGELEIPEGTLNCRLHYGLRALRLALQEKGATR